MWEGATLLCRAGIFNFAIVSNWTAAVPELKWREVSSSADYDVLVYQDALCQGQAGFFSPNPPMGGVKAGQIGMREPTREKARAPLGPM